MSGSAWSNQTITKLIIVGPNGQFLMYSGSHPALNTLLASIVPANTTDTAGNNLLGGGYTAYLQIAPGNFYAGVYQGNGFVVQHAVAQNGVYTTRAIVDYSDTLVSPGIQVFNTTSGAKLQVLDGAKETMAVGPVVAEDPSSVGTPESWHTLGTLNNYVVTRGRFRLLPLNMVAFDVSVVGNGANAVTENWSVTIPAAYRPLASYTLPLTTNLAIASWTAAPPRLGITSAGVVSVSFQTNSSTIVGVPVMPVD